MSLDIGQELKSPTLDGEWLKKVIIGGILNMIPIVNLLAYGFMVRKFKMAVMGETQLPEWKGWGELFVQGLKYLVVSLVYMIVPVLVLLVMFALTGLSAYTGGWQSPNMWLTMVPAFGVYAVLALVFFFFVPMAIARLAATNSMGQAVQIGDIYRRIKMVFGDYLVAYVVIIVIYLAVSLLGFIPVVGWLLMIFVLFYVLLVFASMFGKLYAQTETAQ